MNTEYELVVRQQPKAARMCGLGSKANRRPIDPSPIVQLCRVIEHRPAGSSRADSPGSSRSFLLNPYYFMFASLASPDSDDELHVLKDGKTRCTTGSVVSSLYHLKDSENNGQDAGFFVFPDLSVRTEGSYRLKLSLFEVKGPKVHHCKSIYSSPFYVYTAKKFPGMEESTELSCSLADQGVKIRIRKDIRARKKSVPSSSTNDADDALSDDPEASPVASSVSGLSPEDGRLTKRPRAASDVGKGKGKAVTRTTKRPKLMNAPTSQDAGDEQGGSMDSWSALPSGTSYAPSQPAQAPTQAPTQPPVPGSAESDYPAPAQSLSPVYPPQSYHAQTPPSWPAAAGGQSAASQQPQQQYPPSQTPNFLSGAGVPRSTMPQQQQQRRPGPRRVYDMGPPPPPRPYASPHEMQSQRSLSRNSSYPPPTSQPYIPYSQPPYYPQHQERQQPQQPQHQQHAHAPAGYHYQVPPSEYRPSQESASHGDGRAVHLGQERGRDNVAPQTSSPDSTYPVTQSSQQHYSSIPPSQYYASDPRGGQMQTVIQQMPFDPHAHYQIRNSAPSGSWTNASTQAQQGSFIDQAPQDSSTWTYPEQHASHVDDSGRLGSRPSTFNVIAHDIRPDDSAEPPTPTERNTNLTLPPLRGVPSHQHHPGTAQTTSHHHHHHHQGHHVSQRQHQHIPTHSYYSQGYSAAPVQSPSSVSYNTGHRYGPTVIDSSLYGAPLVHPHSSYHRQVPNTGMGVPAGADPNNIPMPHSPITLPLPNHDPNPTTTVKKNTLSIGHIISDRSGP